METAAEVLRWATSAAFVLLALALVRQWQIKRFPAIAPLAVSIGSLAAVAVLGRLNLILDAPAALLTRISVVVFLLSGFTMLLFRHALIPLRRSTLRLASAAAAGSAAFGLVFLSEEAGPLAAAARLIVIGTWSLFVAEPAIRFWRMSYGRPVVVRRRLRALTLGCGAIIAVLFIGLIPLPAGTHPAAVLATQSIALAAVPLLYASFQPPAWLRRLWRESDEQLRGATQDLLAFAEDRRSVAQVALAWAIRGVGADAGSVEVDGHVLAESVTPRAGSSGDGEAAEQVSAEATRTISAPLHLGASAGSITVVSGPLMPFFGTDEIDWLHGYASSVALAMYRADLTEALRQTEEGWNATIEGAHDAYVSMDTAGRIVEWSSAAEALFGWNRREAIGRAVAETVMPERFREAHRQGLQRYLETGQARVLGTRLELSALRRDGTEFPIELALWATEQQGEPRFHAFIHDISPRKQAERSVQLLRDVATAANLARSLEEAFQACVNSVCDFTGYPVGHAYVEAGGELEPTHVWHLEEPERYETFRRVTMELRLRPGSILPGAVLMSRKPVWIPDVTQEPGFIRARRAPDIGLRAGFALPVMVGEEVAAVLEFYSPEVRPPDEALLEVLEQVGTELGRAVERDRARRDLAEREQRLFRLLDGLPVGVYILDRKGDPYFANHAAQQLLGKGLVEVSGEHLPEVYQAYRAGTDELYPADEQPIVRALNGETAYVQDMEIRRPDRVVPIEVWARPIMFDGEIEFAVASFSDITQRKQAEQELARSNAELERFAYIASHDLQEPLRIVAGYVQLLDRRYGEAVPEEGREFIAYAVEGVSRMRQLIEDLLEYSRVARETREPVPVDARAALDQALANLSSALEESGAEVRLLGPLPTVRAGEWPLVQLFQNLIANGIKFRRDETPVIEVGAERQGAYWRFWVRDNGIGIEPEFHDRIFTVFQRLHGRGEYAGTGIGLAICKRIVERFGGEIGVESEPGCGSTFWFTLEEAE